MSTCGIVLAVLKNGVKECTASNMSKLIRIFSFLFGGLVRLGEGLSLKSLVVRSMKRSTYSKMNNPPSLRNPGYGLGIAITISFL